MANADFDLSQKHIGFDKKLFSNKSFCMKEHQLLKDRRKSTRKRACQGENYSSASLGNISSSRERGLDNRPFKLILCDSQNVKKIGPGRASTKHGESLGVSLGDEKEDTAFGRGGRQRRKPGTFSASFYRQSSLALYCVCVFSVLTVLSIIYF